MTATIVHEVFVPTLLASTKEVATFLVLKIFKPKTSMYFLVLVPSMSRVFVEIKYYNLC